MLPSWMDIFLYIFDILNDVGNFLKLFEIPALRLPKVSFTAPLPYVTNLTNGFCLSS